MNVFKNEKTGLFLLVASFLLIFCGMSRKQAETLSVKPVAELVPEQQRKYDYFFLEAPRLKIQEDYDTAFGLLQHCLTTNPGASSAPYRLVQHCLFLKQAPQGRAALEKAVEDGPDNYWYSQGLANPYQQQDEKEKAVRLLGDVSIRFADKLGPLYTLLDICNRQGQYDKVITTLNQIERKTGKSEQLDTEKFRIYLRMKDNKNVFHEIESLVTEYPVGTHYQVVLGGAYMQNGKRDEAYGIYRKVLDTEPDNAMAIYSLASYYEATRQKELYQRQLGILLLNKKMPSETKMNVVRQFMVQNEQDGGDSTRVISPPDHILEQEPGDVGISMLYAQCLLSKEMDKEAPPMLCWVLAADPTNTVARMMLLGKVVKKENCGDVIELCGTGVGTNPEMLKFYFYLAIAYNQAEWTNNMITVCRKALSHTTDESKKEVISGFYSILGDAYHTKDLNTEAHTTYDSALVYNLSSIGALNNYAYYLSVERRDLNRAEEMSYKTVKAESDDTTCLDTYVWILFEKDSYAKTRLYIDGAMKSGGGKSDIIVKHYDDIYYITGDVDKALEYWKQALEVGSKSKILKRKTRQKKYIGDE